MNWLAAHWERVTPVSVLLYPLSLLFRAAVAARRAAYRGGLATVTRLPVPVVVVGNITAGGTGKTPLVLWLAQLLRGRGYRPGIVSRGYGGTHHAPLRVTPAADPLACGDEPVLLARRTGCEVWTGSDRVAAARALLAFYPDCNVLIADDGLQHYALGRTVEICVIDGARGFGNGWPLPAGPLREPESRLAEVDAIVVNAGERAPHPALARLPAGVPRFAMRLEGREFSNLLNPEHRVGAGYFRGTRVHAIAGMADPARYFARLEALGVDFVPHAFPDHHRYTAADVAFVPPGAVVMTEKDAVKCQAFGNETHWVLPVDAAPAPGFGEFVIGRITDG